MTPSDPQMRAVLERLEALERQNRNLKRAVSVAFLIASTLVWMAQSASHKIVEANDFVLRGEDGKMRARLSAVAGGPALVLFDAKGDPRAAFGLPQSGPFLNLMESGPEKGASLTLFVTNDGPSVTARDAQGFQSVLGVTNTVMKVTGENRQTSAAALTLFSDSGKVIWQAP